jgi:DNA polymerase III gamma/tau subunit
MWCSCSRRRTPRRCPRRCGAAPSTSSSACSPVRRSTSCSPTCAARDALSALDQVAASGEADDVRPAFDELFAAVAAERATDVLGSLAVLHAAGWSASQLATEACAELRQAFLLQLAPDVADAAGSDRARLAALGEALGLPRTVRALETLGRAMVEMRDAPDPTVVLEIALIRLARPELDPSPSALLERLERLERTGAASPVLPATPPPSRPRPALGELRPGSRARTVAPVEPAPAAPPTSSPVHEGAIATEGPDRDALTLAWGDTIYSSLSPRARALYQSGRFTASDGRSCTFAVESEAQREHCERKRAEVEGAITAHFGAPVALRVVVDDKEAPPPPAPAAATDLLAVDLDEMEGGVVADTESIATARVLDAFPGATEVAS